MKKILAFIVISLGCFLYTKDSLASSKLTYSDINILTDNIYNYFRDEDFDRLKIERQDLNRSIDYLFKSKSYLPDALVFGVLGRCQYIVGTCFGIQYNFTKNSNGQYYISTYRLLGLDVGYAAMIQADVYVSLCYGPCSGTEAEGYFIGTDATANFLSGGTAFVEVGYDFSDEQKETIWYFGVGFGVGVGGGFSAGLTQYQLLDYKKFNINSEKH